MLDEPQPTPESHGYATSGWNAAPTAGKVIARIAPLLGLEPRFDLPVAERLILGRGEVVTGSVDASRQAPKVR
jgi:cell division protein FtsI (penicillin-binding protein 3)